MKLVRTPMIGQKIALLIFSVAAVSIVIAFAAIAAYDVGSYKVAMANDLSASAKLVGANSRAALMFDDKVAASEFLQALSENPRIRCAYLFRADGGVLAEYSRNGWKACQHPVAPETNGYAFGRNQLVLSQVLELENEHLGAVHLEADLHELYAKLRNYMTACAGIGGIVLLLVIFLSARHRKLVSDPILHLAALARRISVDKNYAVRAEPAGDDEIGTLIDGFNDMLAEIQQRDRRLQDSEQRSLAIVDSAADAIIATSSDGTIETFNPAAVRIFGYRTSKVIGRHVSILIPAAFVTFPTAAKADSLPAWMAQMWAAGSELKGLRSDGSEVIIEVTVSAPEPDKDGIGTATVIARDITQRKRVEEEKLQLEAQLRQSQKMEAVGVLAGGIAHDFNNILGAIIGSSELAVKQVPQGEKAHANIERILSASLRAKDLVKQMLAFSRQSDGTREPIDISGFVEEAAELMKASLPAMVELEVNIATGSHQVAADPTQIHQIIMNLCTNAYHAIGERQGTIKLELAACATIPEACLLHNDSDANDYVRLSVTDTGAGMDDDTIARVFEPFFTTKGVDEGTGMGLSVVHGIVTDYGGVVDIHSEPDHGTRFDIYLPVAGQESKTSLAGGYSGVSATTGHEHILLVDDEPVLAEVVADMLSDLGFRVSVFNESEEALKAFLQDPEVYDLVLTDQSMPKLTGLDMAMQMLLARPDLPVVIATGYSKRVNSETAYAAGIREFIAKPYSAGELNNKLRRALKSLSPSVDVQAESAAGRAEG